MVQKGPHGIYLKWNGGSYSFEEAEDDLTVSMAKEIIKEKDKKNIQVLKKGKKTYWIREGEYGPFIMTKAGKSMKFVSIPKGNDPKTITLKEVEELVTSKSASTSARVKNYKPKARKGKRKTYKKK